MELVKKGESIPIKAIPEAQLTTKILNDLSPWLCQLLSIKATNENVERLEVLLPMIKDNCWSMPISEIKKAFTMYVQGKLPIEPRDNYLTAILFSKVILEYKQTKKVKPIEMKPLPIPEDQKLYNAKENILIAFDKYKELGEVPSGFHTAFDSLYEWGILKNKETNEKIANWYEAELRRAQLLIHLPIRQKYERIIKMELHTTKEGLELRDRVEETKSFNHPEVQNKFRLLVLQAFFKKLTREELISKLDEISGGLDKE